VAALWPQRVKGLVSVSGYLIGSQEAGKQPLPPEAELQWWYQFYFATERGRIGYEKNRDFAKLIWKLASPQWSFDDATYARSAVSLDNPDHAAVTVSNYRWRLGLERARQNMSRWKRSWPIEYQRADHHDGRRCQWRAAPGTSSLRQALHRQIQAPADCRWRWPQPAARSTGSFCAGCDRRRPALTHEQGDQDDDGQRNAKQQQ
jgi:pimeloyl-ACP methyl ester carboxylesterase